MDNGVKQTSMGAPPPVGGASYYVADIYIQLLQMTVSGDDPRLELQLHLWQEKKQQQHEAAEVQPC